MTDGDRGRRRAAAAMATSVLAGLLVFAVLVAPNDLTRLTPTALARLPLEALVGLAFVLVLPPRARTAATALAGVGLGLLTVLKVLDTAFLSVLARPFDPVLDWVLVADAFDFAESSSGRVVAVAYAAGAALLVAVVVTLVTLAVVRLSRLAVRRQDVASRGLAVGTVVWLACAVSGAQLVPDLPVASRSAAGVAYDRSRQVRTGLQDQEAFAAEAAVDRFRNAPADQLLTALRGKDVVFTFVESYGRVAVEDPQIGPGVGAVLDDGGRRLEAAGFHSRSGFLTSPVAGGASWLAHATFFSGLHIDNEQRDRTLASSDRLTLTNAFRRASWDTAAVMPGTTRAWPDREFYGYDRVHDAFGLGYRGPNFSWATMPDQYALTAFERLERSAPRRAPLMAEIVLVSSHAPWSPVPRLVGWDQVGDGSVFHRLPVEESTKATLFGDSRRARRAYGHSIEYSMRAIVEFVQRYGDKNTVVVLLGDHQPATTVSGAGATHDVPISVIARDPKVTDQIAGWRWQDGLHPSPEAPVWRMESFRDRFLGAFGSTPSSH